MVPLLTIRHELLPIAQFPNVPRSMAGAQESTAVTAIATNRVHAYVKVSGYLSVFLAKGLILV